MAQIHAVRQRHNNTVPDLLQQRACSRRLKEGKSVTTDEGPLGHTMYIVS